MSDRDEKAPDGGDSPAEGRELASYIRHELRTPLNQIIGYSQMLKEEAEDEGLASFVSDLTRIENAGTRLLSLIDGLLDPERLRRAGISGAKPDAEDDHPIVSDERELPRSSAEAATGSILVVDDNEANRDMLGRRLAKRGYATSLAADGYEALDQLGRMQFDLVLLDVMMPGLSGLDVLRKLRETRSVSELPVIMATAKNASDDIVEALHSGANDYVTKPLDFDVVVARVETQLSLKRANDTIRRLYEDLDAAQSRITRLIESADSALENVPAWADAVASDLSKTTGIADIGVWLVESGKMQAIHDTQTSPPSMADLATAAATHTVIRERGQSAIPAAGMTGTIHGAVVAASADLSETERRIMMSFAHQLGGALELQRTRHELAASESLAQKRRQELLDQGIELLHICPRCGACYDHTKTTCEDDDRPLEPFRLLPYRIAGRYRLRRILGMGGMGTVFGAHDLRLDRDVAVKIINSEHFRNPDVRLRFEQEARALAKIDHEGVIAIHDSGDLEDGSGFLVMEMLHGADMSHMIRSYGRGTPGQVASVMREGAAALGAAHRAGLVHRDIKPANLFLIPTATGFQVKILDFGIAKPVGLDSHLTQTGSFVGTPAYMPPEQMSGQTVDARSDLYSFAAAMYEALTGSRVTPHNDLASIMIDVALHDPPPVSELLPAAGAEIDDAFKRALAKRPDERPASVEDWVASLVEMVERIPAQAGGWPLSPVAGQPTRTRAGTVIPATQAGADSEGVTVAHADHAAATLTASEAPTTIGNVQSDIPTALGAPQGQIHTVFDMPKGKVATVADTPQGRIGTVFDLPQGQIATVSGTPLSEIPTVLGMTPGEILTDFDTPPGEIATTSGAQPSPASVVETKKKKRASNAPRKAAERGPGDARRRNVRNDRPAEEKRETTKATRPKKKKK